MIIEVRQTRANFGKEFEIFYDGKLQYTGEQGGFTPRNPSFLYNMEGGTLFCSIENKKWYWRNSMNPWIAAFMMFCGLAIENNILHAMLAIVIYCVIYWSFSQKVRVKNVINEYGEQVAYFYRILKGMLTGYYCVEYDNKKY